MQNNEITDNKYMQNNRNNTPETEEFIRKYVREGNAGYHFWVTIMNAVGTVMYRPKVYGNEVIPAEGPGIICCNHRSVPDPSFICRCTNRVIHFLAKKELHDSAFGFVFRMARTIPVDRSRSDHNAFLAGEAVLKHGELLGIFPEGTRNYEDETIGPLKYGAVRLAQRTGAPIIPMVVAGPIKAFSKPVTIYFGQPYRVSEDADLDGENEKLRQILTNLIADHTG